MKTFEEARNIAQQWEDEQVSSYPAQVGRALLKHIQTSPQVTDEQIDNAAQIIAASFDYPWKEMPEEGKNNMRDIARRALSAPPAATVTDYGTKATGQMANPNVSAMNTSAERVQDSAKSEQEAKPVAADGWQLVPKKLTAEMASAVKQSIANPKHSDGVLFNFQDDWDAALAAAPQEQAPSNEAEELRKHLDGAMVPTTSDLGEELSLWGRVVKFAAMSQEQAPADLTGAAWAVGRAEGRQDALEEAVTAIEKHAADWKASSYAFVEEVVNQKVDAINYCAHLVRALQSQPQQVTP